MKAVVSDFGGVLTSPILDGFVAIEGATGVSLELFAQAMRKAREDHGEHPLFELERGRITEAEFADRTASALGVIDGGEHDLSGFGEIFVGALTPNEPMIELIGELRAKGHPTGLLTNNVREWRPRWEAMGPFTEIFDVIVDSAFVDCRKPEERIYEITVEQLDTTPDQIVFCDDVEINCEAATEFGFNVVHFRETDQAIAELRQALRD